MAQKKKGKTSMSKTLQRVIVGRAILWPDGSHRGGPGYLIRRDDPFIRCAHNLEAAEASVEGPGPAPEGYPRKWARAFQEKVQGVPTPTAKEVALETLESKASDEEIDLPDDGLVEPQEADALDSVEAPQG